MWMKNLNKEVFTIQYVDQHPQDLRLSLVDSYVDLTALQILQTSSFSVDGLTVTPHILGASHAVEFGYEDRVFTEVLACVALPDVQSHRIGELVRPVVRRLFGRFRYTFMAWSVAWGDEEPLELQNLLVAATSYPIGMVADFPATGLRHTPRTIVCAGHAGKVITINTAHSYPNVPALVLSTTTLKGA